MSSIILSVVTQYAGAIVSFILDGVYKLFGARNVSGVMLAYHEPALMHSLISDSTALINIDAEIHDSLDDDEKAQQPSGNLLNSKVFYNKSKTVVDELKEIHCKTSKSVNRFVFISKDYKLLKFSIPDVSITYTLPSDSYHTELLKRDDWNEAEYLKIKTDVQTRKGSKVVVYNNFNELQQLFIDRFIFTLKI